IAAALSLDHLTRRLSLPSSVFPPPPLLHPRTFPPHLPPLLLPLASAALAAASSHRSSLSFPTQATATSTVGQCCLSRSLLPPAVAVLPHASRRHLCRRLAPPQPLPSSFPVVAVVRPLRGIPLLLLHLPPALLLLPHLSSLIYCRLCYCPISPTLATGQRRLCYWPISLCQRRLSRNHHWALLTLMP
ncbi:hypothetical protein B296_00037377, partial [Ensete ventricosum]